jgi:diguanylate cyclase (GGDEF)-like protein
VAAAAGPELPASAFYVIAGCLLLTLAALALALVSRRTLSRELDRRGREHEQERGSRLEAEQKLGAAREELEREVKSNRETVAIMRAEVERLEWELKTVHGRLERVARIDELTGLANRSHCEELLEQEIKRAVREKTSLSLLICEIDYFDEYAHRRNERQRDDSFARIAQAIEGVFRRAGDLVARYGTIKFAIILPGTDAEAAARFGERVRKRVWDLCIPHESSQAAERMTISTGAATMIPNKLRSSADLVHAAEQALLRAHAAGHNRVEQTLVA